MEFDRQHRRGLLRGRADAYIHLALENITQEYPHMPYFIATGPEDYRTHREFHPTFYGSFDWHSCVEMYWVVVRLLRSFGDVASGDQARAQLEQNLTEENLATEVAFFENPHHAGLERPYGWAWLLTLHHELVTWDDPDARRWAASVEPLAGLLSSRLVEWLPKLTYPQRVGFHPNTAFGLSLSLDHALWRAAAGDDALLRAIHEAARRFFLTDADYPAHYEPSGADFLSPALCEAELMSRVLDPPEFARWLQRFLPGLAGGTPDTLFQPATVTDSTDGQIAHLHGLNLSRAWALVSLAERLPAEAYDVTVLLAGAERQASASLPHVVGDDYMVSHWLAAYATLLLST